MTDLVPFPKSDQELAATIDANVLQHYAEYGAQGLGGHVYAKFVKGAWVIGAEEAAPGDDEVFAVNPMSFVKGAICWKGGRPVEEIMYPVASGKEIVLEELPDHGPYERDQDGWSEQAGVSMKSLDSGLEIVSKGSSHGFKKAVYQLCGEFATRVKSQGQDGKIFPLVMLRAGSYKHDDYGTVYFPKFDIVGWASNADLQSGEFSLSEEKAK